MRSIVAYVVVALASAPALAADEETLDIKADAAKYKLLTDGKGHYLAGIPFEIGDGKGYLFYGDGKTFYAQRRTGGGANGEESFDTVYWEPRVNERWKAGFGMKDGKYWVQCDNRKTDLKAVPDDEAKKILGSAAFKKVRWKRRAYALARDNSGVYYYVDQAREPDDNKDFRVFRGQKGALKPQKMVNIVSDSEGEIFETKAGKLRFILGRGETTWIAGKTQTKLIVLPIEDNHVLIYTDLGVYAGQPLGTPCDDL